mmetsp:Transcript_7403/g.19259  ORF Transcript_7403/g.19259 Transcript_7403/m.19259 type:complete len:149 (-) Transcript_7403:67-513(-)
MGNILVQAWVSSAPGHYRGDERSTLPFRANPRRFIRAVAEQPLETLLVFDGAKSEAKAHTHSLRLNETRRADILAAIKEFDIVGKHHLADKEYRKLAYPVPDFVVDWVHPLGAHSLPSVCPRRTRRGGSAGGHPRPVAVLLTALIRRR